MPLTSFYAALTGLNNNAQAISVIGNNLANINTTAFKTSKTSFAELLGEMSGTSTSGNPIQVGLGSTVGSITPMFTQGSVAYTGKATDAAINGNGFFVVDINGGNGYTRSGSFSFTSTGELINSDGFNVLGYTAVNGVVNPGSALSPIVIQKGSSLAPKATANLSITANLDSSAATNTVMQSSVEVYDSLGTKHIVTLSFTKTSVTDWSWSATIPAVDTGGAATAPPVSIGSGTLIFNSTGGLTAPAANPTLALTGLASGAANQNITFGVLDPAGKSRFTGYAAASSVSSTTQDGYSASALADISIDNAGVINGLFDNGQVQPLAQLALANFPNVEGLLKFQGSTFVTFGNSGEPSIGTPGSGGRGSISGGSLEQSNVDIATEFTNLIVAERGYQANSKIITTTDQLYQEAINLKQ